MASKAKEGEAFEMENSEVRFYDVRSRKGRLPFLKKVNCCVITFLIDMYCLVQILSDCQRTLQYSCYGRII